MSQIIATPQQLTELRDRVRAEQAAQKAAGHKQVRICMGAGCIASGAEQVKQSIEAELERSGVHEGVSVIGTGCLGPCSAGPTLMIDDVFYENVKPQDGSSLVNEHVLRGQIVSRLTHRRPDGRKVANAAEMDFFKRQAKIVLRNCGVIDPQRIEDYIARDGYQALAKVVADQSSQRGHRDDAGFGPPRPRRRRFPHLAEVEADPRVGGRRQVRRLQCRRRRSGGLHGPQRAGGRSAQRDRRHGHRRPHDRRLARLYLRAGRIPAGRRTA